MQQTEQFAQWALLELMGHQKLAGYVTEKTIAGFGYLHVLVPQTDRNPAFSRLVSPSSIYAINPIDEDTAKYYANQINAAPIQPWNIKDVIKAFSGQKTLIESGEEKPDHFDKEDENEEADEWPNDRLEPGD